MRAFLLMRVHLPILVGSPSNHSGVVSREILPSSSCETEGLGTGQAMLLGSYYETGSNGELGFGAISYPCRSPFILLPAGVGLPGWYRALRPQCVAHYQQGRSHA